MEIYNTSFCLDELLDALSNSNDSAVGPDDIHYQMLKHLPSEVLHTLLNILNDIRLTGNFPSNWRQSYVVPIAKPGKDTSNQSCTTVDPTHGSGRVGSGRVGSGQKIYKCGRVGSTWLRW